MLVVGSFALAEPLTVIGFNVESGGADPNTLSKQIASIDGCDIWGFSEVQNGKWSSAFEKAAEDGENADFKVITGKSGGGDKLAIVYDADRFECLGHEELEHINIKKRVRAPLVVHLKEKSSQVEFKVMVNHLYRSRDEARHKQAQLINEWAKKQTLPVIAVGDYNFDWDVSTGKHDRGFDNLTAGGVFDWVKPLKVVRTHCSPRYNSVLDFVFVSGEAKNWAGVSEVVFAYVKDYCPDNTETSDHFPVKGIFNLPPKAKAEALPPKQAEKP